MLWRIFWVAEQQILLFKNRIFKTSPLAPKSFSTSDNGEGPGDAGFLWGVGGNQRDSPFTELPSPRGREEWERLFSVFSELEPFWLWWSADEAELEEGVDVDEGLAFSLKSVMMTVRSPTVTSRCWALLRSIFFNLGLTGGPKRKQCIILCLLTLSSGASIILTPKTRINLFTSSSCGCSSWVLALFHSCLSRPSPSFPFWAVMVKQTAVLLAAGRRAGRRDEASWLWGRRAVKRDMKRQREERCVAD